jgi:hypothetical protein
MTKRSKRLTKRLIGSMHFNPGIITTCIIKTFGMTEFGGGKSKKYSQYLKDLGNIDRQVYKMRQKTNFHMIEDLY